MKTYKLTYLLLLVLALSTFGCSNDDNGSEVIQFNVQNLTNTIDENPTNGDSVGTIETDGDGSLTFSIASQTPAGALSINTSTGELTIADATAFDFETNPVITATIAVVGTTNTGTVTINLNDVEEIVVGNTSLDIDENPTNGDVIGTLPATSANSLAYTITFQNPAGAMTIDQNTGALSVADESLFDFETNPNMLAVISVDDGSYSISANATIDINNFNEIGDFNYGGVIFWVNAAGNEGLVCDIEDVANPNAPSGITWSVGANVNTGATDTAIGAGQSNTTAITNSYGATSVYAASLCDNLTAGGYSDWYLPSLFELHEIANNMPIISATSQANGGNEFIVLYHWSSTEMTTDSARVASNNGGTLSDFSSGKNNSGALVRPVRSWTDL